MKKSYQIAAFLMFFCNTNHAEDGQKAEQSLPPINIYNNNNNTPNISGEQNTSVDLKIDQQLQSTIDSSLTSIMTMTNSINTLVEIVNDFLIELKSSVTSVTQSCADAANYVSNAVSTSVETISNLSNDLYNHTSNKLEQTKIQLADYSNQAYAWGTTNKLKVTIYCALGVYLYSNYRLFATKHALEHTYCWSLWKTDLELEALFLVPQIELGRMLAYAAQERYTQAEKPHDYTGPITQFLLDLETERLLLEHYINLCRWIKRLHTTGVMWHDAAFAATCKNRLTRLAYLRSAFAYWLAEYKLGQHMAPATT